MVGRAIRARVDCFEEDDLVVHRVDRPGPPVRADEVVIRSPATFLLLLDMFVTVCNMLPFPTSRKSRFGR